MERSFLTIAAGENGEAIRALSAPARIEILKLLCAKGPLNINDIAQALSLPQSTVATGIQILEDAGLVDSRLAKARKGNQKICSAVYSEILISFEESAAQRANNIIEVEMPVGLYTSCDVHAPAVSAPPRASSARSMCPIISSIRSACRPASSGSAAAMSSINFLTMPRS